MNLQFFSFAPDCASAGGSGHVIKLFNEQNLDRLYTQTVQIKHENLVTPLQ
jgi:hypothetical protein